jgi:hypothetical protein
MVRGVVPVRIRTGEGASVDQKGTMMRRIILAAMSACLLAGSLPHAQAQQRQGQQQPGFTPQELDRMSQQRMEERGRVDHGPPPPLSSVPKEQLFQPAEPWICKSTQDGLPIYSQPSASSPKMGNTMSQVAVGGRSQNGFARILFPNGRIGWLPADQVRDYVNEFNPSATCQVKGVRADGGPVFSVR